MDEDIRLPTFEQIRTDFEIDTQSNFVDVMVFSPDGAHLAMSGFDGGIKLFGFPEGELQHWLQWGADGRYDRLYGAVFSRDGETLITCGTNVDQMLRFWDVKSWDSINEFEGYQTSALDVGRLANEAYLAIGLGNQVRIFRLPEGQEVAFLESQLGRSHVASLRFIPETKLLAVGGTAGGVELWDFDQREIVFTLDPDRQDDGRKSFYQYVKSLGYDPTEGILMALLGDGRLSAWNVSEGKLAWELALQVPHGWYINTAAFSEDGRRVAVGMHNGPFLLFDSHTGQTLSRQWTYEGTLMQLALSPDGEWLAVGYANGRAKIWQVDALIHPD